MLRKCKVPCSLPVRLEISPKPQAPKFDYHVWYLASSFPQIARQAVAEVHSLEQLATLGWYPKDRVTPKGTCRDCVETVPLLCSRVAQKF